MGLKIVFAIVLLFTSVAVYLCSEWDLKLGTIALEDVYSSDVISTRWLLVWRLFAGCIIWSSLIHIFFDPVGLRLKLLSGQDDELVDVHLVGIWRFSPFTVWCWTLQGSYFAVTSICGLAHEFVPHVFQRDLFFMHRHANEIASTAWVMFEISFAMAFLVTFMVTFVLIPGSVKRGIPIQKFYAFLPLLMHNMNVANMAIELFINKFTFEKSHVLFAFFFADIYSVFAIMLHKMKGFLFYFFLDYNKPLVWSVWLIILISVFSCFFMLGYFLNKVVYEGYLTNGMDGYESVPLYLFLALTLFIMKFPEREHLHIAYNDCFYYVNKAFTARRAGGRFGRAKGKKKKVLRLN